MLLRIPKGHQDAAAMAEVSGRAVAAMLEYNEELSKAGVLLAQDALLPPSLGARVSFPEGNPAVTDGFFPDAKEAIGGYWMIQVRSKQEAIEWAKRCPASEDEVIEVRQVRDLLDSPAPGHEM